MLKLFEVSNYKTFNKMISIDFTKTGGYQFNKNCLTNGMIGKMLIYGRNATGKTNLGKAILDIVYVAGQGVRRIQDNNFLNADSEKKFAEFNYVFQFDDNEIQYKYKKVAESQLLEEELFVNGKMIFHYDFESKRGHFKLNTIDADTADIQRYLDAASEIEVMDEVNRNLPFLRWLINNTALKDGSILLQMNDYIKRMNMLTAIDGMIRGSQRMNEPFYEILSENDNLKDFEEFLNTMGVECELKLITLPEGQKELYFVHNRPVPFNATSSSGTLALTALYKRLFLRKDASLLYIDEFDAFYHYEMSEKVVMYFKEKYPKCQLILTTHNTNLMTNKLMRPDCLFIISRTGELTALADATERELREGHNLEKLYISGEFEKYE